MPPEHISVALVPAIDLARVRWIHGAPDCERSTDPPIQVLAYDDDTFILRQSKCVDFEAPFLYVLFGTETVLLHDSGATEDAGRFPIRRTVDGLIASRLRDRGGERPRTIVTHSHGHGDHHAGDVQFADLPLGSVAPIGAEGVAAFFGIADWPAGRAVLDLGGRSIDVLPAPGHLADHVVLFDRTRGLLLTGDTLLPGPLTVRDWGAYRESIRRIARFCRDAAGSGHAVRHVLGAHIEMSHRPGVLYDLGTTYQPDEFPLPLTVEDLFALEDALDAAGDEPRTIPGDRFIVQPMDGASQPVTP
jgi:glyoxylase-like metal-dependent hydrolase (beta-lactamase superfamily II)